MGLTRWRPSFFYNHRMVLRSFRKLDWLYWNLGLWYACLPFALTPLSMSCVVFKYTLNACHGGVSKKKYILVGYTLFEGWRNMIHCVRAVAIYLSILWKEYRFGMLTRWNARTQTHARIHASTHVNWKRWFETGSWRCLGRAWPCRMLQGY